MQTVQFERAEAEQVIRAFRDLLLPDMREESFSGRACRALVTVLESRLLAGTDGIWFEDLFPELTDQRTVFMRITEDCDTSDGDIQLRNKFCGDGLLSVSDLCRMSDILTQNEVNTGSDSGAYIRRITEVMRALKQDHTDDIRIALTQDEANAAARALRKAADVEHDKGAAALLYAAIRKLKKEEAMPDKIHLTLTQEEADAKARALAAKFDLNTLLRLEQTAARSLRDAQSTNTQIKLGYCLLTADLFDAASGKDKGATL